MTTGSLAILLDLAGRRRDAASSAHQRAVAAARAAAAQSTQLLDYRREYEQRWQAQFAREGRMELVRCYHQFMAKLTQAVEHQARIVAHADRQTEHALGELRELEMRCAAVAKLIERRDRELRVNADRVEQKQTDEVAMRLAWARRDPFAHP